MKSLNTSNRVEPVAEKPEEESLPSFTVKTIIGYKCTICGATGNFDDFPHRIHYNEFGKEKDTFCKNEDCDGQNDDLEELFDSSPPESEPVESAEEILQNRIAEYNSTVNDMSKFKLNHRETKMFTAMMEEYASLRVAQEKAELIEKLKVLLPSDEHPDLIWRNDVIDLIKNS